MNATKKVQFIVRSPRRLPPKPNSNEAVNKNPDISIQEKNYVTPQVQIQIEMSRLLDDSASKEQAKQSDEPQTKPLVPVPMLPKKLVHVPKPSVETNMVSSMVSSTRQDYLFDHKLSQSNKRD